VLHQPPAAPAPAGPPSRPAPPPCSWRSPATQAGVNRSSAGASSLASANGRGRWTRAAAIAATALIAGLSIGRFVTFSADAPAVPPTPAVASPAGAVAALEARVADVPDDADAWRALGVAQVREAIRTGDPFRYAAAETAFDRSDALAPGVPETLVGRGVLSLSLHDFAEAHRLGSEARAAEPYDAEALAVLVDASVELGRYDEATAHVEDLLGLRPDLAAYSRLSYVRELHGDVDGALSALGQAESAGSGSPFDAATVVALQGDLLARHGDLDGGEAAYERSLRMSPDVVAAEIGLARIAAARGDVDAAIDDLEELTRRTPLPAAVILLGDLQALDGRADDAEQTYALVRSIATLQEGAGVGVDLELAQFEADRQGVDALERAEAAYAERATIFTADALAWARLRSGDVTGAVPLVEEALRLGTNDAVLHYHAAAVYAAAGDVDRARAELGTVFSTDPFFSFGLRGEAEALADQLDVPTPAAWEGLGP
jgi:tetratricopeptide (TPR) repeat protein